MTACPHNLLLAAKAQMYVWYLRLQPYSLGDEHDHGKTRRIAITLVAQHPPKQVNFDSYYMYALISFIFFPTFMKQLWISTSTEIRLLQRKGRLDLGPYASRRSRPFLLEGIPNYGPKIFAIGLKRHLWESASLEDNGYICKLTRDLMYEYNFFL